MNIKININKFNSENCPRITFLDLSHIKKVSDISVTAIAVYLKKIQFLNLESTSGKI